MLTDGEELEIAALFSREDVRADAANHCVPILDSFVDDLQPDVSYIVMPFLRSIDDPPFETVEDIVHFADQAFEVRLHRLVNPFSNLIIAQGLAYIHEHGVAHRYARSALSTS